MKMLKAIIFDFCRVLLFPKNESYFGRLNALHDVLSENSNYNFAENFEFNYELMDFIKEKNLNARFELYLLTSGKIQERHECQRFLGSTFREIYSGKDLKMRKNRPSTYLMLAEKINKEPQEILFIDNNRENTIAAEQAGLSTVTFRNNIQFETEVEGYI